MSVEKLEESARKFNETIDKGLEGLNKDQQQVFMNGVFLALNSYFTLASPEVLTPFDKERFMGSARSNVYSKTNHLGLDDSLMKLEMENGSAGLALHYTIGAAIQEITLGPLSFEEKMELQTVALSSELIQRQASSE